MGYVGAVRVRRQRSSRLTQRTIKRRAWGVALGWQDMDPTISSSFHMEARPDQRGATVEWLGTRGLKNFGLKLTADGLTGDLHILLRADHDAGEAVHLGF